jgi:hypothetical protein
MFWFVFWPNFLLSLLLNGIRIRYSIQPDFPLIICFAVYTCLCSLGLILAVQWEKSRGNQKHVNNSEKI